jgi:hypothetical protein
MSRGPNWMINRVLLRCIRCLEHTSRLCTTFFNIINFILVRIFFTFLRNSRICVQISIYKTILKPIWTYGIQLWGTASISNIQILERFHSKALRTIVDAPWYVPNTVIGRDLQTATVKEEIRRYSSQYSTRLSAHPNGLLVNLMEQPENNRQLRRHLPNDQPTRLLV